MNHQITNNYVPYKVLKIYKELTSSSNFYIEIHGIRKNENGEYSMTGGKPLKKSTFRKLISAVDEQKDEKIFSNIVIPSNILCLQPNKHNRIIIWYTTSIVRQVDFTDEHRLQSGMYKIPALLYFVSNEKLRVFALKDKQRPELHSQLFYAPIFNGTTDFQMCWGNIKNNVENIMTVDEEMEYWQNMLWKSKFSSHTSYPGGNKVLEKYYTNKKPKLISVQMNISQLIKKYVK